MPPVLRLTEDVLANGSELALPPLPRMIFVVHGGISIAGKSLGDGETWHGEGAVTVTAGAAGAACWRFELAAAPPPDVTAAGVNSREKLTARLDTLPAGDLLLRGYRMRLPP